MFLYRFLLSVCDAAVLFSFVSVAACKDEMSMDLKVPVLYSQAGASRIVYRPLMYAYLPADSVDCSVDFRAASHLSSRDFFS